MAENIQTKPITHFSFIGAGNLGAHFIHALRHAGYNLKYVLNKSNDLSLKPFFQFRLDVLVEKSDFIVVAVQESKLAGIVKEIAELSTLKNKIFFHVSNSLTSDELLSLKKRGASIASFSPLQTFLQKQNHPANLFKNIFFLFEGDGAALKLAWKIARSLESRVLEVKKEDKVFLHLAAIAVSNFLVSLFLFAEEQIQKTSVKCNTDILFPLCRQTLANISEKGIQYSLSGPVARGEQRLVRRHLRLLQGIEKKLYQDHCDHLAAYQQTLKKVL